MSNIPHSPAANDGEDPADARSALDGEIYSPYEMTPAEMYDDPLAAHVYMTSKIGKQASLDGIFATPRTLREVMWGLDMVVVNGKVMTTGRNRAERRQQAKQIYLNRKG